MYSRPLLLSTPTVTAIWTGTAKDDISICYHVGKYIYSTSRKPHHLHKFGDQPETKHHPGVPFTLQILNHHRRQAFFAVLPSRNES